MAYREAGRRGRAGRPASCTAIPTSSYIWRNIIPLVAPVGTLHRARSDRLRSIRQARHRLSLRRPCPLSRRIHRRPRHQLGLSGGAGLGGRAGVSSGGAPAGFRARPCLHGVHPADAELGRISISLPAARETFRKFRTPGEGEAMILDGNAFVERVLPGSILRKLGDDEMAAYRAPFPTRESRRPMLALPRELPIAGEPADVYRDARIRACGAERVDLSEAVCSSAEPGALVSPAFADRIRSSAEALRRHSSRSRAAQSAGGSCRGHRPLGRRLDRRDRGRDPARGGRPPELTRDAGDQNGRRIDHLLPALRL